jgi:hypothetical protein
MKNPQLLSQRIMYTAMEDEQMAERLIDLLMPW